MDIELPVDEVDDFLESLAHKVSSFLENVRKAIDTDPMQCVVPCILTSSHPTYNYCNTVATSMQLQPSRTHQIDLDT